jgi:DNA helicase-2/ATP-dependent DNA helicase PcrA
VTLAKLFAGEHAALPKAAQEKINAFYATLREIKILTETLKPSELIRETIRVSGIEAELKQGDATDLERLENIQEMVSLATRYDAMPQGEGIEKMLDDAALASDQDGMSDGERIRMMTVHASKGLEFQYVFITGLEQDLFPHAPKEHASTEHREEERRLFYVALTRAEKKLFLTYATIRTLFGMRQVATPSEFLYDIPEALVEHEVRTNSRMRTIYLD